MSGGEHIDGRARPRAATLALALFALVAACAALAPRASARLATVAPAAAVRVGPTARVPRGAVDLGPVPGGTELPFDVVLRPRDPQALEAFLHATTTPGSASFGQHLAKGQFATRFGAAPQALATVESTLAQRGLRVDGASSGGLLLRLSGAAGRISDAFALGIHRYRLRDGRVVRSATAAPALPRAAAEVVTAVVGLSEAPPSHPLLVRPRHGAAAAAPAAVAGPSFKHPEGSPQPCAAATAAAHENGGLTDDRIANAYGAFGLYGQGDIGEGVHVGVFEQEPFLISDLRHFDKCYFGGRDAARMTGRVSVIPIEGGPPPGAGEGEAILDVEDLSAMAPGASLDVYESPETAAGELSEIAAMIDEDRDQLITSSWGQPCEHEAEAGEPGYQQAESLLFQQAAAQGQTFMNAAGDTGSDACEEDARLEEAAPGQDPVSTTELASQPYVLGVGGTTITNAATTPATEKVWNDGGAGGGGGGGISQSWAMPTWQRYSKVPGIDLPGSADYLNAAAVEQEFGYPTGFCDATLPAAEADTPCRLVPDVSAQADEYTGAPTFYSRAFRSEAPSGWVTIGGTSSASPIWAGMLALADASPTCRADPATAGGVGFVSPLLYGVASEPAAYAASFNDITEGNNDIYGFAGESIFPARKGFDLATGLGSPRLTDPGGAPGLAYYLCRLAAGAAGSEAAVPTVTGLSPAEGSTAGGEKVLVSGSGFESGASADVAGVQVGTWQAPSEAVKVIDPGLLSVVLPPARDTLPAGAPRPQDGSGPVQILVTLNDGKSSATDQASTFTYVDRSHGTAAPSVTELTPYGGSETAPAAVTIIGSGFEGATGVSFGGVAASSFHVLGDSKIAVTPPPLSGATACSPLPAGGVFAGEGPSNDVCQVEVVVEGPGGASRTARILPPREGELLTEQDGTPLPPPGCHCEVFPAVTEYDYLPAPSLASASASIQGSGEEREVLITAEGSGLNHVGLEYAFLGPAETESSIDYEVVYETGTKLELLAGPPGERTGTLPLSVRTLAGLSAPVDVTLPKR